MKILERYDLPTPEVAVPNSWFADWARRRPGEVSQHLTAGFWALAYLEEFDFRTIYESFGGMGVQALVAEDLWPGAYHVVRDFSPEAAAYLAKVLPESTEVLCGDSYAPESFFASDLQIADFGDLTALRMHQPGKYHDLCERLFTNGAEAVVLTDIAGPRLHLVGRSYVPVVGPFSDYPGYLRGLGEYVRQRWGYSPGVTYYHRWSSVTSFLRSCPGEQHKLIPTPSTPIGIRA